MDFSELITLLSGRDLGSADCNSNQEGIPYLIGASNIIDGKVNITRWTTKPLVISKYDDILISCKGTIGEIVANKIGEIHIARQFMAIQTFPMIYANYIELFIRSIVNNIKSNARGVIPGISREDILHQEIALPPLNEQKRIVIEVKKWFDLITTIETEKLELESYIKQAKSKVLDLAIQGKLVPQDPNDEPAINLLKRINPNFTPCDNSHYENLPFDIPQNWEWIKLNMVCNIARGGSPRPIKDYITNSEDGINWIKIGDTDKDGKYINSTKEKIIPEGIRKSRMVHKGDFLLTNSMSFGRPYILNVDGCIHDGWLVISPRENTYNTEFLYYLLSSKFAYEQFAEIASGGVVSNLNSDKVANSYFPILSISEQKRISDKITQIWSMIDTITAEL